MITINWSTKVISVPQSYLTFQGGTDYELDIDQFRLDLRDLEDDVQGMPFDQTHNHNTEFVLSGTTYARVVELINGYTVTFEAGSYRVLLRGANSNISDFTNLNGVSIDSANSAGLTNPVADQILDATLADYNEAGSVGEKLNDADTLTNVKPSISV
jgi:hypothetical protein